MKRLKENQLKDLSNLGNALKVNTVLKHVDLRLNWIKNIESIAEALVHNTTLTRLNLKVVCCSNIGTCIGVVLAGGGDGGNTGSGDGSGDGPNCSDPSDNPYCGDGGDASKNDARHLSFIFPIVYFY